MFGKNKDNGSKEAKQISYYLLLVTLGATAINIFVKMFSIVNPQLTVIDYGTVILAFLTVILTTYGNNKFNFKQKIDLGWYLIIIAIFGVLSFSSLITVPNLGVLSALYQAFLPMLTGAFIGGLIATIIGFVKLKA